MNFLFSKKIIKASSKIFALSICCVFQLNSNIILAQNSWVKKIPGIGTFSSPRVTDLNGDGIGDIILGSGRQEFEACDSAIIALDGLNGELLWNVSAQDQIFGSASLKDLNNDGIKDVIINGRSAELQAISGGDGTIIWRFDKKTKYRNKASKWFNFYNPQFIPDQNGDGHEDILITNGGDVMIEAFDPNRPAGNLMIIDSHSGEIISLAPMPDGKETYMSVSACKKYDSDDYAIILGTGGETIGGSLFLTYLSDVLKGDISSAIPLATSKTNGFTAPPVWVDITEDSIPDIVANAGDGRLLAFNGKGHEPIWAVTMKDTEAYSSISVGHFTEDNIPDFFVSYAQGSWPNLEWAKQFMVNGKNGKIEFTDSLGYLQLTTPVAADLNSDYRDEAILNMNYQQIDSIYRKSFFNILVAFDFKTNKLIPLTESIPGHNISTTPWIGDIDGDNLLDVIYCHSTNEFHTYTFDGFQVNLLKTGIPIKKPIKWGAYMGSNYDGVY
ncbi:MAG: outer membrane protein assembly factor BamB [Cyclobacteriaceae bacterium]|jgi:outer membrane protein assembly factor BamB